MKIHPCIIVLIMIMISTALVIQETKKIRANNIKLHQDCFNQCFGDYACALNCVEFHKGIM